MSQNDIEVMCFHHGSCIKHQRSNPLLLDTLNESRATCTRLEDTSALTQDVQEVARLSMLIHRPILASRGSNQASESNASFSSRICILDFDKARRPKCQSPSLAIYSIPFEFDGNIYSLADHVVQMNRQAFCQPLCLSIAFWDLFVDQDR